MHQARRWQQLELGALECSQIQKLPPAPSTQQPSVLLLLATAGTAIPPASQQVHTLPSPWILKLHEGEGRRPRWQLEVDVPDAAILRTHVHQRQSATIGSTCDEQQQYLQFPGSGLGLGPLLF
jgi:hypothetical protein